MKFNDVFHSIRLGLQSVLLAFLFVCTAHLNAFAVEPIKVPQVKEDAPVLGQAAETLAPYSIVVNLPSRELRLFKKGKLVKTYSVAVGNILFPSPLGRRLMRKMVWNPWWYPPKNEWGKEYQITPPGGENPMGPVKLDLMDLFFIHGNNDPKTIGYAVTHGCVRMFDEDVIELAKLLMRHGTQDYDWASFNDAIVNEKANIHVALAFPVEVNLIYDLVDVAGGKVFFHEDIYQMEDISNRQEMIEDALIESGYEYDKIRHVLLKRDLKFLKKQPKFELLVRKYLRSGKKTPPEEEPDFYSSDFND